MKRTWSVFVLMALVVIVLACLLMLVSSGNAKFQAGKTESHSLLAASSGLSAAENSTFNAKRVLFVRPHGNALIERVGDLLIQQLTNGTPIAKLEVIDSDRAWPSGGQSPDLFIRLIPHNFKVRGVVSSSVAASISCFLGTTPWRATHFAYSSAEPPIAQFSWSATAQIESKFVGVRSDRLTDVAKALAGDFARGISNQIVEMSAKYPPLPELPSIFYGRYEAVADLPELKAVNARRVCSYSGLLMRNETFWLFETPPALRSSPVLDRLAEDLKSAGWKASHANFTNTHSPNAHFSRPGAELDIFRVDLNQAVVAAPDTNAWRWVAHYRKPFSESEREAALETLLQEPAPAGTLLPFRNNFSFAQQKRFFAALESARVKSPLICLQLADHYLQRRETNSAIGMLVQAKTLCAAANDPADIASRIDNQAKRISQAGCALTVTAEICRELGFLEATNGVRFEADRKLGEPLLLFREDPDLTRMAFVIDPGQQGQFPCRFSRMADNGVSARTSSFIPLQERFPLEQSFSFGKERVRLKLRLTSDKARVRIEGAVEPAVP